MTDAACLRIRRYSSVGLAAGLLWALTGIAAAQTVPPTPEVIDPSRQAIRRGLEIEERSREAEEQRLLHPERTVTYEDVLANPDDIDLNYAYAQAQIARGDVRGAAATLERILLINPDLPRVRLLYAVVLYRLDNLDEAERELLAVRSFEMPASLRAELDRYLEQISLRRKRTRFTATVGAGIQYDWNRNAAPASGTVLVGDLPASLELDGRRQSDWSTTLLTRVEGTHDLGYQARHRLIGAVSYYRGEQARLDTFDTQAGSAEIGGVYDVAPVSITPTLYARRLRLANQYYGHIEGTGLRADYQYASDTVLYALTEAERQEFRAIAQSPTAPERSGPQYIVGTGIAYTLSAAMRVTAELTHIAKRADRDFNDYDGNALTLTHSWIFERGLFLLTSLNAEIDHYDQPDLSVSEATRRDRIGRARLVLGVPVASLVDEDGQITALRDLVFLASAEALRASSNITNYTYENRRFSVGFTKRWEF